MTEWYKGLLIDSCPQRRGWLRWQLGSLLSVVAPGSGLCYPTRQPNSSLSTQSRVSFHPVHWPFPFQSLWLMSCYIPSFSKTHLLTSPHVCFLLLLCSTMWLNTDLSFSHIILSAYTHQKCVCVHIFVCVSFSILKRCGTLVCISSVSKQQLRQPWHISECFFSGSPRKWSAPHLLIPLHSAVHQGDFVFTA